MSDHRVNRSIMENNFQFVIAGSKLYIENELSKDSNQGMFLFSEPPMTSSNAKVIEYESATFSGLQF